MGELKHRLAAGEQAAFAELYDACAAAVHRWLVVRLGSTADAADLLQETFVRLARAHRKLGKVDNLPGYVFRVAYHESARLLAGRKHAGQTQPLTDEICDPRSSDALAERERAELVASLLSKLTPSEREVVELKLLGGRTLREISEITGTPPGTVATRYRTALLKLRRRHNEPCHE